MATNILMKERIYSRVNDKYQSDLPKLATINQYLHLHWAMVALKQKRLAAVASLGFPAAFSLGAWQLLQQAISFRKQRAIAPIVKKVLA